VKFFRVRNFERFQHYHDRRPPWIKLYRDLWDEPRFFELQESERYLLIGIFVLASQHDNRVSTSQSWLKAKLLTSKAIPLQRFVDTGWIEPLEQDASKHEIAGEPLALPLADSYPSRAGGETETEIQRQKTETEKKPAAEERRGPFVEFFFAEWQSVKGRKLIAEGSDFAALDRVLKATAGDQAFALEKLRDAGARFIRSQDPFHQRQGHPLRYFASNINAFMGEINGTHRQNGTGGQAATRSGDGSRIGPKPYTPKQR
jgi:hypothetical protein